jgi:hypothetical protein
MKWIPKKGKLRLASQSVSKRPVKVQYVPKTQPRAPPEAKRRMSWGVTALSLGSLTDDKLHRLLLKKKLLFDWAGKTCPLCKKAVLTGLRKETRRWHYRCRSRKCHRKLPFLHRHPFFSIGHGGGDDLKNQSVLLLCLLAGVSSGEAHLLTGCRERFLQGFRRRLLGLKSWDVQRAQSKVIFGGRTAWTQGESDEVSLRCVQKANRKIWQRYMVIMERGNPKKTVLLRLPSSNVKGSGQGGGGAIKKKEWKPIAEKWLAGTKFINHCDSARAYRTTKINGVKQTWVRHSHKKIGSRTFKPCYVKKKVLHLPRKAEEVHMHRRSWSSEQKLTVVLGTQMADNFFKHMRAGVGPTTKSSNPTIVNTNVRAFQWNWMHRNENLWDACGLAVQQWFEKYDV